MKIAIIDSNYKNNEHRGLAASWLHWELEQAGITECDIANAEYILMTVSSQQGYKQVKRFAKKVNSQAKIILGGGGCYAPAIFDSIANVCCVGEGKRFIQTLLSDGYDAACALPEAWIPGDTRAVIPNGDFPWNCPPLRHPDGTVRVWGARGCKYRCMFCQTGWEIGYRTNPDVAKMQRQIDALELANERVAIITNDGAEETVKFKGQQEFLSVRLQNLRKMMPLSRSVTKSVRIGVEGISERLRVAVGKPVPNEDLISISSELLQNGVGVRWFFVPGLPGEKPGDYEELQQVVNEVKRFSKGVVMMNFHAFIPQPATPLSVLPLTDEYWEPFDEFRRWFFHGPGFTRRVQIVAPAQYKGRLQRAKESMAATEAELRRGWLEYDNANWRVQYLAPPDKLRKIALIYANRVELNIRDTLENSEFAM